MLPLTILVAAVVVLAVMLLFVGMGRIIAEAPSIEDRLETFVPQAVAGPRGSGLTEQVTRRSAPEAALRRLAQGEGFAASMSADLAQANLPLTVAEYLIWRAVSVAGFFLLGLVLTRQVLIALLVAIAGFFVPQLYLRRRQAQRLAAFQLQLPDVITLLVGALRSGYGLTIAMDTVAKQMPEPTAEEFRRVVTEIGLGVAITQALANLVRRIRSEDLDLIVTAVSIQYEVGGNLATILETISDTIRERIRLQEQLRVLTSQARLQRIILSLMPFVLGVVIYLLNPEYMLGLFTPGPTLVIPIGAVVLMVLGYFVMGKLGKIEI